MPKLYADLHLHPTMYGFNRMRNDPAFEMDESKFHPWYTLPENLKHMDAGERAAMYSQSDMPKSAKAGLRLMFASITPIEKEFFGYFPGDKRYHSFAWEVLRFCCGVTPVVALWKALTKGKIPALQELTRVLRNHGPLRSLVQQIVMGYSRKRVKFLQSAKFDYWEEYLKEYDFYLRRNGQRTESRFEFARDGRVEHEHIEGCYHLIQDGAQLRDIVESDSDEIGVVLTIEGSHVLSIDPRMNRVSEEVLFERISSLQAQEHPVFFITFAHHFDNGLCGHAHSILDLGSAIMDQTPRMHEGFEPEGDLGFRAACALLGLDESLEPTGARRILLDIKHMSVQTRREYYNRIVRPYRELHATWGEEKQEQYPCIPLVASHACYSGVQTFDELEDNAPKENDNWHVAPFYAWNINLCDEDIEAIFESGGLVGLCFEQRVAGVGPKQKMPLEQYANLLVSHLFAFVDVILLDDRRPPEERIKIWDCVCLGTDYDGFIDPLTAYPTVLSLDQMAEDLKKTLTAYQHTRQIASIGVDNLLEKICWRNAYDFTQRHWPRSQP